GELALAGVPRRALLADEAEDLAAAVDEEVRRGGAGLVALDHAPDVVGIIGGRPDGAREVGDDHGDGGGHRRRAREPFLPVAGGRGAGGGRAGRGEDGQGAERERGGGGGGGGPDHGGVSSSRVRAHGNRAGLFRPTATRRTAMADDLGPLPRWTLAGIYPGLE